jgi:hypothetical protein
MHKSFFYLFFISLTGVLITALVGGQSNLWRLTGLVAGLAPLVIYHFILYRKKTVSATEVDSIYYFGFLVTVVMLVAAALSIGLSDQSKLDINKVLVQFSLGLVATGYALFSRLQLLTKLNTQTDVLDSTEKLAKSIEKVAGEFDRAGYHVTAFVELTQQRMSEMERGLQMRSEVAANAFEKKLNDAALAFNSATEDSLGKAYGVLDTAIRHFSTAISSVSKDVARIQSESESISFVKTADRIEGFSKSMESTIESITSEVALVSESSVAAISELTASARRTQQLAQEITQSLESLSKLESLLATIEKTTSALEEFSTTTLNTGSAISLLGENIGHADAEIIKQPATFVGLGDVVASLAQGLSALETQTASLSKTMTERQLPLDAALLSATSGFNSIGEQVSTLAELGSTTTLVVQQLNAIALAASQAADKISGSQESFSGEAKPSAQQTPQ